VHLVGSDHSDPVSVNVLLIQRLLDSSVIVSEQSSVLHELDSALLNDRSSLGSVVHDCHLEVPVLINNGDC